MGKTIFKRVGIFFEHITVKNILGKQFENRHKYKHSVSHEFIRAFSPSNTKGLHANTVQSFAGGIHGNHWYQGILYWQSVLQKTQNIGKTKITNNNMSTASGAIYASSSFHFITWKTF